MTRHFIKTERETGPKHLEIKRDRMRGQLTMITAYISLLVVEDGLPPGGVGAVCDEQHVSLLK